MSLAQRVAELEKSARRLQRREPPLAAEFIDTATGTSDDLRVIAPSWDGGEHAFGPVKWHPIGGALPQAGDECMIVERSDGVWTVAGWWSSSQGTGIAQSTIDVLDARIDALEATRKLRGRVDASGGITSGAGFSVVRNGTGDYTISFSPVFGDVPVVQAMVGNAGGGLTIKEHPSATISASAVRLTLFTTATVVATDAPFSFFAEGAA